LAFAKSDACEIREETVDPATQEKTIKTKWEKISHSVNYANMTVGRVSGISVGDDKYLGVRMPVTFRHVLPADYETKLEDTTILSNKDRYKEGVAWFASELKRNPTVVPAGSKLRIILEDRTEVVLETAQDFRAAPNNFKIELHNSAYKKSAFFLTKTTAELRYALDADAISSLTSQPIMNMRVATGYQYITFGRANLVWDDPRISKKTKLTVQKVLKCVL
jgi:hypothetical protein